MESHREYYISTDAEIGVAPEIVTSTLDGVSKKLLKEVKKINELIEEIKRRIALRRDMITIKKAREPQDLCYVAIDSSFTSPAIELVGGYLGIVVVTTVFYGSRCGKTSVDSKAYVDIWFNEDLTSEVSKVYERKTALNLLEKKGNLEVDFDVLLIDGEIIPRTLKPRALEKFIEITNRVLELADKTDTAVVGVLKRSYARDLVNILGFTDLRLSDKAVMSLVLEEGEYLLAGTHDSILLELEKLRNKRGVNKEWLETRLKWYEIMVNNIPIGYTLKLAFYRAPRTIYPTATKIEYMTSSSLDDDAILSNLIHISSETGIPAPIDYADRLSTITRDLRVTVYNKLLAELAKRETRNTMLLFSLMNPEKLIHILG